MQIKFISIVNIHQIVLKIISGLSKSKELQIMTCDFQLVELTKINANKFFENYSRFEKMSILMFKIIETM